MLYTTAGDKKQFWGLWYGKIHVRKQKNNSPDSDPNCLRVTQILANG
ncbi:MAG: hypothetical protein RRZ24_01495 [Clostridia bacterium]